MREIVMVYFIQKICWFIWGVGLYCGQIQFSTLALPDSFRRHLWKTTNNFQALYLNGLRVLYPNFDQNYLNKKLVIFFTRLNLLYNCHFFHFLPNSKSQTLVAIRYFYSSQSKLRISPNCFWISSKPAYSYRPLYELNHNELWLVSSHLWGNRGFWFSGAKNTKWR